MGTENWAVTGSRLRSLKKDIDTSAKVLDNFFESEDGKEAIEMHRNARNLRLAPRNLELFRIAVEVDDGRGHERVVALDASPSRGSDRFKGFNVDENDVPLTGTIQDLSSQSYLIIAAAKAKMRPEAAVNLVFEKLDELSEGLNKILDEIGPAVEMRSPSGLLYF